MRTEVGEKTAQDKEAWIEPEVVAHEPLLDVTGQKYKERD